eukprot:937385-Pelagomonas_calceolata.AAC.1
MVSAFILSLRSKISGSVRHDEPRGASGCVAVEKESPGVQEHGRQIPVSSVRLVGDVCVTLILHDSSGNTPYINLKKRHIGSKSRESPSPECQGEASVDLVGSWQHVAPSPRGSLGVKRTTSNWAVLREYGHNRAVSLAVKSGGALQPSQ